MDLANLLRRIENLIRLGTIAEIDLGRARVRVASGSLLTDWLPWLHTRAGTSRDWDPPSVGEQVMNFSPSGDTAVGIVLCGINSSAHPAPSADPDECVRLYPDGACIRYNHASGALAATGIRTALLQAAEHCTVDCPATTFTGNVHIQGNLLVDGEALIKQLLSYLSGMAGSGGSDEGATTISGAIRHEGQFSNIGGLSSNGISLPAHTHPGDSGGSTGAPQ